LRSELEREVRLDSKKSLLRQEALDRLLLVVTPAEPNYSINGVAQMVGKTVDHIEYGSRQRIQGVHGSELVIVYFSDGSIMSLHTGSNAMNVLRDDRSAEEFNVSFQVDWVPPRV
jgi:hypothetical protein